VNNSGRNEAPAGIRSRGVLALFAISFLSAGCRTEPVRQAAPAELRIGVGAAPTNRDRALEGIGSLLFSESLLTRQMDGRTVPGLATSWRWEDEGRRLRLELKDQVRFHDGSILTSDIAVKLLRQNLENKQSLGFAYVTNVAAENARTIVIQLSRPDFFLLPELSGLKVVQPNARDIGTGPFRIVRRTPTFETVRFDAYHGGVPAMKGAKVLTFETQRAAWAALLRREVDALQEVSRETVEFASQDTSIRTYPSIQPFYIALVFNQKHPLLKNVEVRRALNAAIDRESIVQSAMRGHGQVARDPIWPLHWAYTHPNVPHVYDPKWAEQKFNTLRLVRPAAGEDGSAPRFKLRCLFWSDEPMYERIALMLQRQLFDVGVDLILQPANLDEVIARANSGEFETLLPRTNAGRSLDFTYRFWHSSSESATAMLKAEYFGADSLLDELRASTSDDEVRSVLSQLGRRFREDVPAAFIAWPQVTRAIDSRLYVGRGNEQDPFAKIWEWRPAESAAR
jgi:peptide/nickel transport system substrate-binding protein